METRNIHRTCTICEASRGIEVQAQGREVVRIRGDREDPFSRGHVCPKVMALRDLQDDPDRIRRPLRRTRGGAFEAIGWDAAYDLAASGLDTIRRRDGNDAVELYRGNPAVHDLGTLLGADLLAQVLQTRNIDSAGSMDTWPRWVQASGMYGGPCGDPCPTWTGHTSVSCWARIRWSPRAAS